jgi:hypothetical protein
MRAKSNLGKSFCCTAHRLENIITLWILHTPASLMKANIRELYRTTVTQIHLTNLSDILDLGMFALRPELQCKSECMN